LDEWIDPLETILRRERLIIGGCLAAMVLVAWSYLLHSKAAMAEMEMPGMIMPWDTMAVVLLFVMWAAMMVAMMVPSQRAGTVRVVPTARMAKNKRNHSPKTILKLPDLERSKSAVLKPKRGT
jgi:predicted metal-binding membrane protein